MNVFMATLLSVSGGISPFAVLPRTTNSLTRYCTLDVAAVKKDAEEFLYGVRHICIVGYIARQYTAVRYSHLCGNDEGLQSAVVRAPRRMLGVATEAPLRGMAPSFALFSAEDPFHFA
jgi:hypothetical protein